MHSREALADTPASGTDIVFDGVASSTLYDFDPDAPGRGPSGELIAGVLQRFEGPLSGTALFALDPGDALLWLQRGEDDGPPLDRFVDWGSRVLGGAVQALAEATHSPVEQSRPVLEERPLMAALLGTHAPSDTVVLSIHGSLVFPVANLPELRAPFSIQVLLEPKRVAGILAALAGGDDGPDA